jgi:hypothetical protein
MKKNTDASDQVHSYLALRKTVGWIGILLPFVLVSGNMIFFKGALLKNISVYYHTGMHDVFVGAISAIALFLFFYRGYDRWDDIAASIAGVFAIGIAFFPTVKEGPYDWVATVHYWCAACFFGILALFTLILFTRGEKSPTGRKNTRNFIYRACGIIMIISLVSIEVFFLFFEKNNEDSRFVLFAETATLIAFGISWLTKGGSICPDKN